MYLYSILDKDAQEFGPIFTAKNDTIAKRNFEGFINSGKAEYPKSLELYNLGYGYEAYNIKNPISALAEVTLIATFEDVVAKGE